MARFFHDKKSDNHQETYQSWNISDEVSYTTKNKDVVVRLSKKHNNYTSEGFSLDQNLAVRYSEKYLMIQLIYTY